MKRSINHLIGCRVHGEDADIGRVEDFYFDDHKWIVRYMIMDTGRWLHDRQVLISTAALGKPEWKSHVFPVNLTKQKISDSPSIDTDKPVSRQHETELHDYYNWPFYWSLGLEPYVGVGYPAPTHSRLTENRGRKPIEKPADPNLRSTRRVTGYSIQAVDGEIGHVDDFIVDDETWAIRYVVVNTQKWLPRKKVLIFPTWIKAVSWDKSRVVVDLSRESIKSSPVYDPSKPVSREYEIRLFNHYDRPEYWVEDLTKQTGVLEESDVQDQELRIPALIIAMGNRSVAAREALVAMGKPTVGPLMEALANSTEYGRGQAAKALGEIGDVTAAPALVNALEDDSFDVRWLAARALVALGRDGLPALLQALIKRPNSKWLRAGARHILRDEGYETWQKPLAPVLKALEGYAPQDTLPDAAEEVLQAFAPQACAPKK